MASVKIGLMQLTKVKELKGSESGVCIQVLRIQGWASLVAQWLGVCLPMQGTQVHAPVREDPACRGAVAPMSHGR